MDGQGLRELCEAIAERLLAQRVSMTVQLTAGDGRLRAKLFQFGEVLGERVAEDGSSEVDVIMAEAQAERLRKHEGLICVA